MDRAFTMCFKDAPSGGGRIYLGMPPADLIPRSAITFSMADLSNQKTGGYYAVWSLADPNDPITYSFDSKVVATQTAKVWNHNVNQGQNFIDSGTAGLYVPYRVLGKVIDHLHDRIKHHDHKCKEAWGDKLKSLTAHNVESLAVTERMRNCAMDHMHDLNITVGPGQDIVISKSSFFYESQPCSGVFRISWASSGDESITLGTSFFFGKTLLFNTTDLSAPMLVDLGPAGDCQKDYGQIPGNAIPLHGVPGQVLGPDGTITAEVAVGTPPQTLLVQLDTGSQKFFVVHPECRKLANCFLVAPPGYGPVYSSTEHLWLFQTPSFQPQYQSIKCQKQVEVMRQALNISGKCNTDNRSSDGMQYLFSCACESSQACLRQALNAMMEDLVPSQVCGITRKACGEATDFHFGLSASFEPANPLSLKFASPPEDQDLSVECQHSC
eukprot:s7067_g5.t1